MTIAIGSPSAARGIFKSALGCWNWKCALMSATARSLVYLAAMARTGLYGGLAIVVVEMAYVTLTAGVYAGLQQKALSFRSRLLGNLAVAVAVPMTAQLLTGLRHHPRGAGSCQATLRSAPLPSSLLSSISMSCGAAPSLLATWAIR